MTAWDNRPAWVGAALAAAVVIGGCGNLGKLASATTPQARLSPLVRSIESYVHAISVQSVRCGAPGRHGRKSCEVEFTDTYGQWFATLVARGSTIVADPGGVSDWLCNGACANPPPMTGNTGKFGFNTGTGNTGATGVTGVVTATTTTPTTAPTSGPTGNGVVAGSGTGVVSGSGSGVVYGTGSTGSGATTTPGSTGAPGVAGSNGVVYGTGSTGSAAPSGAGTPGGGTRTAPNGVVYGTGSTGPGAPKGATGGGG